MDCVTKVEQTREPGMHSVLDAGPLTITQHLPVMTVECKTDAAVDVVFQGDTYVFRSFFEQFSIPGRYADSTGSAVGIMTSMPRRNQPMLVSFVISTCRMRSPRPSYSPYSKMACPSTRPCWATSSMLQQEERCARALPSRRSSRRLRRSSCRVARAPREGMCSKGFPDKSMCIWWWRSTHLERSPSGCGPKCERSFRFAPVEQAPSGCVPRCVNCLAHRYTSIWGH